MRKGGMRPINPHYSLHSGVKQLNPKALGPLGIYAGVEEGGRTTAPNTL